MGKYISHSLYISHSPARMLLRPSRITWNKSCREGVNRFSLHLTVEGMYAERKGGAVWHPHLVAKLVRCRPVLNAHHR